MSYIQYPPRSGRSFGRDRESKTNVAPFIYTSGTIIVVLLISW